MITGLALMLLSAMANVWAMERVSVVDPGMEFNRQTARLRAPSASMGS